MHPVLASRADIRSRFTISIGNFVLTAIFLALCLGARRTASAQTDVGYILGSVTDQTGAAVPGAAVTITSQATGISESTATNDSGLYTSRPLQVGPYTVQVTKSGFTTASIQNLTLVAAAHMQANVTLYVGSTSEKITVEATPPIIDNTDAQLGTTIDERTAQQLPVNGRSVLALATLSPGVESALGAVSEGFVNRGTSVSAIRIDGGVSGLNEYLLDGVSNMQDWLGEIAINLKSDSIQEYEILSGIMPAQFGYTSGGAINAVTRAGTNTIHGSAYEFFRNDALDASPSFPRPAFGKGKLRFNNYGGTLGGPILRNRMFLFGNYEQFGFTSESPGYYTVPTVQERGGDFSDLGQLVGGTCKLVNIYDATNVVGGQRQQFSHNGKLNVIDPSRLDPVALAYQQLYYPLPNNTSGSYNPCSHANNFLSGTQPNLISERLGVVRSDYKISDKDSMVARYAYYLNKANNGGGFNNSYVGRNDVLTTQSAVLSETHVFGPSIVNDARFGLMRSDFPFLAATAGQNIAGKIGLPNDTPLIAPTMNNGVVTANNTIGFRSSTMVELIDDVTWIVKNQTIHVGASARWTEGFNNQASSPSGTFNFSAGTTQQGNDATVVSGSGSTYASYLLGQLVSASQDVQQGTAFRRMLYAGYFQDDWRITPRLTINAGLRYDKMTQAVEKHNGIENFDITKPNPSNPIFMGRVEYANYGGNGRNFVKENWGDFGPRLGFAYQLPDNKTTVRGGGAIYYPSTAESNYDESSGNPAGYTSQVTSWSSNTAHGYNYKLSNGLPGTPNSPLGIAGGPNAFLGQSASYINPNAKDPSSQVISLTISRLLPAAVVINASYGGNHGNHFENFSPNLNFLSPQYYGLGTAALSKQVTNPYAGLVPGSLGAPTLTQQQLLKPYPYMYGVSMLNPRNGSYWSNLAMLSVERHSQHGLEILGAYTFGKITDAGIQGVSDLSFVGTFTGAGPQNPYDPKAEHSLDAINVTHRLTIAGLYNLPFGSGQRFLSNPTLDRVVGGWQYNAILTIESGRPLGIYGANNQLASRPNINPNVKLKVRRADRSTLYRTGQLEWFNPLAFVNPPDYTFGNAPRRFGNLNGPGTVNVDMSLFKTTHITDRLSLELRLEAYNALNHPNLPNPNTGFSAGPPADPANPTAEGGLNTSTSFGMITSGATSTRNLQLGGKLIF